jgi:hypothetical protein
MLENVLHRLERMQIQNPADTLQGTMKSTFKDQKIALLDLPIMLSKH